MSPSLQEGSVHNLAMPLAADEVFPVERLGALLAERLEGFSGDLQVTRFPGGLSNVTYGLRVGNRRLVLRRPPPGAGIRAAHDMAREFRMLRALTGRFDKIPRPYLLVEDPSILGAPFYLAQRVDGLILRERIPAEIELGSAARRALSLAVVDTLLALHSLDPRQLELGGHGRIEDYASRQVRGWSRRYRGAATEHVPEMDLVEAWLLANRPAPTVAAVIHNDFKIDNLVLDPLHPDRVLAVLDWEMATVGDPLMDVGIALAYWAQDEDPEELKAFGVTHLAGHLSRREMLDAYQERGGREISDPLFYYVFGIYRNTVMAQQLYRRHQQGFGDARFASLGAVVRACARQAMRALETRRI